MQYKVYEQIGRTTEITIDNENAEDFVLIQNYPNPFNQTTKIQFYLPKATKAKVAIYNSLGKKVNTLFSDNAYVGSYTISWDSTDEAGEHVSSGVYFYEIITDDKAIVRKMLLLR